MRHCVGLLGLAGVVGFDKILQAGQVHLPEGAVLAKPGIDRAQRLGIELVDAVAAFAVLVDQMGCAQKAKVFRDSGTGNREGSGNRPSGLAALAKQIQNRAAGRVG